MVYRESIWDEKMHVLYIFFRFSGNILMHLIENTEQRATVIIWTLNARDIDSEGVKLIHLNHSLFYLVSLLYTGVTNPIVADCPTNL